MRPRSLRYFIPGISSSLRSTVSASTLCFIAFFMRSAELDRELDAAFANSASNEGEKTEVTEQEDDRPLLDDHEIEIAHALNDLL